MRIIFHIFKALELYHQKVVQKAFLSLFIVITISAEALAMAARDKPVATSSDAAPKQKCPGNDCVIELLFLTYQGGRGKMVSPIF